MLKKGEAKMLPLNLNQVIGEALRLLHGELAARQVEVVAYLAPELLAMTLSEIAALHLSREWNRLLKSGGHHRKTKQARPLSGKTVTLRPSACTELRVP